MAKGLRSSGIKKNKVALKKRVFGPVEEARNERLNAKLMELAQTPKERREEEMVLEQPVATEASDIAKDAQAGTAAGMDVDNGESTKPRRSNREIQRIREARQVRTEKKRHRKPQNRTTFATHPKKRKGGK